MSQNQEGPEELAELIGHLKDNRSQEKHEGRRNTILFFRLWFGLNKHEIVKTVVGSLAAALSGISKPVFGYFIVTIGVAYYEEDAKHKVGRYSMMFSLIGLLSLFTHTLQHYFFGVIGEKAMTNLRRSLFAGIKYSHTGSCIIFLQQIISSREVYVYSTTTSNH